MQVDRAAANDQAASFAADPRKHHPELDAPEKEDHPKEIGEIEQLRRDRDNVPAGKRKDLRISLNPLGSDVVDGVHGRQPPRKIRRLHARKLGAGRWSLSGRGRPKPAGEAGIALLPGGRLRLLSLLLRGFDLFRRDAPQTSDEP